MWVSYGWSMRRYTTAMLLGRSSKANIDAHTIIHQSEHTQGDWILMGVEGAYLTSSSHKNRNIFPVQMYMYYGGILGQSRGIKKNLLRIIEMIGILQRD
jgi:hypothetical protein